MEPFIELALPLADDEKAVVSIHISVPMVIVRQIDDAIESARIPSRSKFIEDAILYALYSLSLDAAAVWTGLDEYADFH